MYRLESSLLRKRQPLGLLLLCIFSSSAVSEAGVMTAPIEPVAYASSMATSDLDEKNSGLFDAFRETLGMSNMSGAEVEQMPPTLAGISDYPSARDESCQRLVSGFCLAIPCPIPFRLLKVPIDVTQLVSNEHNL